MRTQRLRGNDVVAVHSKRKNLLGFIGIEPSVSNPLQCKCYVYVYRHTDQSIHSIGVVGSYGDALRELRYYEDGGD